MARRSFASVGEYIGAQPIAARAVLRQVRTAIRKALGDAEETISYQIPTYKVAGKAVIYFAAWKNHYSIYPATRALVAKFEQDLARYEISKGTIRFSYGEPVPAALITRLAAFRAKEAADLRSVR